MEVHAHSHSHGKKTWKSYFWEFLMLFLAVFCGFLAEYQLEHKIEKDREKQFIRSFIEDLKTDTNSITRTIKFQKNKLIKLDSLMFLLATQKIKGYETELYYFGRVIQRSLRFSSNDRTITQLKNSGSLRLIRNEEVADSMISYQKVVDANELDADVELAERQRMYPILSSMFSPFIFDQMVTLNGIHRPENNPPLRSYDPSLQQDLAFYVHQLKGSNYLLQRRLERLFDKAINTIVLLKKEYHLE